MAASPPDDLALLAAVAQEAAAVVGHDELHRGAPPLLEVVAGPRVAQLHLEVERHRTRQNLQGQVPAGQRRDLARRRHLPALVVRVEDVGLLAVAELAGAPGFCDHPLEARRLGSSWQRDGQGQCGHQERSSHLGLSFSSFFDGTRNAHRDGRINPGCRN
jgi:hypothetical protein